MAKFDTRVQELKYQVLKEIAKAYFNNSLMEEYYDIPKRIIPGPKPTMRCCIYKERAIVQERMKLALGGNKNINNVVEVIRIACDDCPLGGYEVTNRCRGCIAHRCENACPRKAIIFDPITKNASIDKERCINCGMCAKACQYNAIVNFQRPCEQACKLKAITMDDEHLAEINDEKCIQCGACVYQCPFGAIMDKSFITKAIDILKENDKHNVYAVVAPSIATQFKNIEIGKVITALLKLGFSGVYEAALGADFVSYNEAKELSEKGFLTSSCCPAFVNLIKQNYPHLKDKISANLSPMATIAKLIKEKEPECKIIFVGPCIAKKKEIESERVKDFVDCVITFEELQALIDAKEIDVNSLEEAKYSQASYFGRIFGKSNGIAQAVKQALYEQNIDFCYKPISVDGIENCRNALNRANGPEGEYNFIEGMACPGGCIGGPCSLSHEMRDKIDLEKHSQSAEVKTITDAMKKFEKH